MISDSATLVRTRRAALAEASVTNKPEPICTVWSI